jgi:DNA-binding transcriptional MerR regulator
MKKGYAISELAMKAGVTKRTVHYYISKGLISPHSGEGINSSYSEDHLYRIILIKKLQEEFYPLKQIKEMIQCLDFVQVKKEAGKRSLKQLNEKDRSALLKKSPLETIKDVKNSVKFPSVQDRSSIQLRHDVPQLKIRNYEQTSEELVRVKFGEDIELIYPMNIESSDCIRKIKKSIKDILVHHRQHY